MTPIPIRIVAIALSVSCGSAGAAGSTQGSRQNATGTPASERMADGKEWTTANLNVNASPSYCYDDAEPIAVDTAACIRGSRRSVLLAVVLRLALTDGRRIRRTRKQRSARVLGSLLKATKFG